MKKSESSDGSCLQICARPGAFSEALQCCFNPPSWKCAREPGKAIVHGWLFEIFAAFMDENEETAHGECELMDFIHFIEQFSSIPHSAIPAELLPKIIDMILRCSQNDKLASHAGHLLCALVECDPMCCEVVMCPSLLSFVLKCARGIERRPYESSWHQQLFSVVGVATDAFGPFLRQYVTVDNDLWLQTVVGCIASGLDRFQLRALPVFLRFLLTFAEVGCDDGLLIDRCLGGIAKLLRAELATEFAEGSPVNEVYYAANLVYELMKSPGFSLDSLRCTATMTLSRERSSSTASPAGGPSFSHPSPNRGTTSLSSYTSHQRRSPITSSACPRYRRTSCSISSPECTTTHATTCHPLARP